MPNGRWYPPQFCQRLGSRLDDDVALDGLRIVQVHTLGLGRLDRVQHRAPGGRARGSAEGGLIVSDIDAARGGLAGCGIDASETWHGSPFPAEARQPGPAPRTGYGSFFSFTDPDGNAWLVQKVTTRLSRAGEAVRAIASVLACSGRQG